MAEVAVHGLTKVFPGGAVALDNVDMTIADGEFVVLVGPSGCGKSTLLRIVAGLEDATAGSVMLDGRDITGLPPRDRDIAMVFQNYALYPHMTVEENMAFALKIHKVPKAQIRQRVAETAHVLGLEQLLDRRPKALSGGQRQRVAMGRAIVRQPAVFLMDEPLSNLDAKLRVAMRGELTRLHQRYRTTTIYVTHDQIEAMTLGDRIAVLNQGRLQQVGTPDELYRRPGNVFVAGFIGSPAMNLARGRLERCPVESGLALVLGQHRWPVPAEQLTRRPTLTDHAGRPVIVGLRPTALSVATEPDAAPITVNAVTVESLGSQKNVLFLPPFDVPDVTDGAVAVGDSGLTAMWTASVDAGTDIVASGVITLALDLSAAYFFDDTTGVALDDAAGARAVAARADTPSAA